MMRAFIFSLSFILFSSQVYSTSNEEKEKLTVIASLEAQLPQVEADIEEWSKHLENIEFELGLHREPLNPIFLNAPVGLVSILFGLYFGQGIFLYHSPTITIFHRLIVAALVTSASVSLFLVTKAMAEMFIEKRSLRGADSLLFLTDKISVELPSLQTRTFSFDDPNGYAATISKIDSIQPSREELISMSDNRLVAKHNDELSRIFEYKILRKKVLIAKQHWTQLQEAIALAKLTEACEAGK